MIDGVKKSLKLFYSYAHEDESFRLTLEKHLSTLRREGFLSEWSDRKIVLGDDWDRSINENLESSNIILLLISPDFLQSDYCWEVEVKRALQRNEMGVAKVVPIILRPCDWLNTPINKLQAIPKGGKPLVEWKNEDAAYLDITNQIRKLCNSLLSIPGDPSNPYVISKIGDWIEQESVTTIKMNNQKLLSRIRTTVIGKDKNTAIVRGQAEVSDGTRIDENITIDLNEPFEDNAAKVTSQVTESIPANAQISKNQVGAGEEKLFIGQKVYYTTWKKIDLHITVGLESMIFSSKTWFAPEIPMEGIVKFENNNPAMHQVNFVTGYGRGI